MLRSILILLVGALSLPSHASPEIQEFYSVDGAKVLYVQATELPMVDIAVTFDAGSEHDQSHPGLSMLTHALLSAGTEAMNADQVAASFENVGARYGNSVELDRSSVSLRSLVDPALFKPALKTFIQIIAKPAFPERDFARVQQQMLVGLRDEEQRPSAIVETEFQQAIFAGQPYGQPQQGTIESISSITQDDLVRFHQRYFSRANATLAIVGDVNLAQAKEIAKNILQAFPKGEAATMVNESSLAKSETIRVPFPSQQAHVRIGQEGIERGNPDYFALYVGNHILGGGGFTSRLVKEVRGNRGLSYSVYSYFLPYRQPGTFTLGLQTRVDQVEEAVEVSRQVLQDFINEGPTSEELALSKQNIMGGFPLRIDSNSDILQYLAVIGYYDLPLDYLTTFNQKVEKVTLEDIRSAFKKHVDPAQLTTVIVGGEENT